MTRSEKENHGLNDENKKLNYFFFYSTTIFFFLK